jgi:hypothetical protein
MDKLRHVQAEQKQQQQKPQNVDVFGVQPIELGGPGERVRFLPGHVWAEEQRKERELLDAKIKESTGIRQYLMSFFDDFVIAANLNCEEHHLKDQAIRWKNMADRRVVATDPEDRKTANIYRLASLFMEDCSSDIRNADTLLMDWAEEAVKDNPSPEFNIQLKAVIVEILYVLIGQRRTNNLVDRDADRGKTAHA